jgi:alkylation response protein AidB-like acyl-CoA dehydrogenase
MVQVEVEDTSTGFRRHVRQFLRSSLPTAWTGIGSLSSTEQEVFRASWRSLLHQNGLLAVTWPTEYGGAGLGPREQLIVAEECTAVGVPQGGLNDNFGIQMLGSTLLRWGTEEQRRYYLPRILSGDDVWCQGFSEPDAGSDLAGLRTRAVVTGDHWQINGQKIWTSYGHLATHIFVLCRTDISASKHQGISLLLCELDQPGIDIRPLNTLTGEQEFNEVFFTDATCPLDAVVGPVNGGWSVAMDLLGYERGEAIATLGTRFRRDFDRLYALADETGQLADPVITDRLAHSLQRVEELRCLGEHAVKGWLEGRDIGAESSLHKLFWSEWLQLTTELAMDILGHSGITASGAGLQGVSFPAAEAGSPNTASVWVDYFLRSRAATIYAGSSEIQRNIIGERMLGLPKEPR